ncbi:ABC transporter substrate-binding protein [Devosia sp.]|uniref:ABC transporter substrate-binding protein n=1 Tax=Devosia sp. TaxID=1871048 RepID=UPI00345C3617
MSRRHVPALLTASALAFAAFTPMVFAQDSDTLVIARSMDVNSLDPARAFCDTCQIYLSSTYETLVTLAPDNQSLVPSLAASWDINPETTEFTFHLNPKAVFADGSPVEAKDVKWSFERLLNLKGSPSFLLDGMTSVEAVDAKTVKVTVTGPDSEFVNKISATYAAIINSDVAIEHGAVADASAATADTSENWFLENSAGSGPFTLAGYTPESELRFARNEAYYGTKSPFSTVVITQVQDAVSQAQALESGAVDIAMQIDPDTAASMSTTDVTTEVVPSFNFVYVAFSPGAATAEGVLTPEVREALALAIDYDGMLDFTVGGNGVKQSSPIPNGFPGTAGLPEPKQDIAKAKELLAAAGHPDGFTLSAVYPNDNVYGVDLNLMMQKVQQDWAAIGVTIDLQPQTYPVWRDQLTGDGIPVTAVYYAPDYYGSGQYVAYFAMTAGTPWAGRAGGKTPETVVNPAEANLYAKALASTGEASAAFYNQIGLEMIKDKIIIPLVSPNLVLAYKSDLAGVRYSACCNLPINEITRK